MTSQHLELIHQENPSNPMRSAIVRGAISPPHSTNAEAIAAGLDFLFSCRKDKRWRLPEPVQGGSEIWLTAYVLARLGEVPAGYFRHSLRQRVEESLDWLQDARAVDGGWAPASGTTPDAMCTAWAIAALRQHGRRVPESSLDIVRQYLWNGRVVNSSAHAGASRAAEGTAIAIRALGVAEAGSVEFLGRHLLENGEDATPTSRLLLAAIILDWEPGIMPRLIMSELSQVISRLQSGACAVDNALLLRCLTRLRLQSAWPVAADLRSMQQLNGCWHGTKLLSANESGATTPRKRHIEANIVATATALSALALGEFQPGLYFGSDLPFRRL